MATKTLTKDEWTKVIERFKYFDIFNLASFAIDGYHVQLKHINLKNRIHILIVVNGKIACQDDEIKRKFYPIRERFLHSKKTRDDMLKVLGKRKYAAKKDVWELKTQRHDWLCNSIQEAKRVFEKNCDTIELIENSKATYHF